jgi:hypothetical protein
MHRVLGAFATVRDHGSDTGSDEKVQLLESACRLIESASPDGINATSVYAATSSRAEAERLAEIAHQLAVEHQLAAVIELGDGRLHVKFVSGDLVRARGG